MARGAAELYSSDMTYDSLKYKAAVPAKRDFASELQSFDQALANFLAEVNAMENALDSIGSALHRLERAPVRTFTDSSGAS